MVYSAQRVSNREDRSAPSILQRNLDPTHEPNEHMEVLNWIFRNINWSAGGRMDFSIYLQKSETKENRFCKKIF